MQLPAPLYSGILQRRYKRFLADVVLDSGELVTAHCANPGSMLGLNTPGAKVWLSKSDNPKRKLAYSWELLEVNLGAGPALVGINTSRPNNIVTEAIQSDLVEQLKGYKSLRREVKYGVNSRIDILLQDENKPDCYVEVKNVHLMRRAGLAEFPDSVTQRGKKHLDELGNMVQLGHRAMMVFLVQRNDARQMTLARDIDVNYGEAYDRAVRRGVEIIVLATKISLSEVQVTHEIPMVG